MHVVIAWGSTRWMDPRVMVVFSKIFRGVPSDHLPFLFASVLVFRSAFLPSSHHPSPIALSLRSQSDLASDAPFFPLHHQQHNPKSKLSLSSWQQLRSLLRIVIPSIHSREALLLIAHSAFLVLRTVLSVAVAKLDGRIVRDLVCANGRGFLKGLALWFVLAVPSIYTNAMVRRSSHPASSHVLIHPTRSATSSPSSPSVLGTVSLGIFTTSTSRHHLTFAITASLFRASTSISPPISRPGRTASPAYSTSPVSTKRSSAHSPTRIQWQPNEAHS